MPYYHIINIHSSLKKQTTGSYSHVELDINIDQNKLLSKQWPGQDCASDIIQWTTSGKGIFVLQVVLKQFTIKCDPWNMKCPIFECSLIYIFNVRCSVNSIEFNCLWPSENRNLCRATERKYFSHSHESFVPTSLLYKGTGTAL